MRISDIPFHTTDWKDVVTTVATLFIVD